MNNFHSIVLFGVIDKVILNDVVVDEVIVNDGVVLLLMEGLGSRRQTHLLACSEE